MEGRSRVPLSLIRVQTVLLQRKPNQTSHMLQTRSYLGKVIEYMTAI